MIDFIQVPPIRIEDIDISSRMNVQNGHYIPFMNDGKLIEYLYKLSA